MTKTKEPGDITDIVPQKEIDDLPTAETREDKLIRNLYICKTVYEAAILAGYSENTAKSTIYTKLKNERFKNKIRDYAISNDLLSLPKIAYIENQILNHLMENPLDTPKYSQTLKQKKKVAGILGEDVPQAPQVINIKSIEKVQVMVTDMLKQRLEDSKKG